jgi:hypothetical protein
MASESFLRPAAVMPPRRLAPVALAAALTGEPPLVRRSAHRRFMANESRRLPAGVRPLPRRVGAPTLRAVAPTATLASSRRAAIARPIRSLSVFNSEMIRLRSNVASWSVVVQVLNYPPATITSSLGQRKPSLKDNLGLVRCHFWLPRRLAFPVAWLKQPVNQQILSSPSRICDSVATRLIGE